MTLILGIESSCDETAAAIVENGRILHASVIASQADLHALFGGVVPELASREHSKAIVPVVRQAMKDASCSWADLDGIAVTYGPGLIGALLVGVSAAKGMAQVSGLPLYGVHHIAAHVSANFLAFPELEPPFICLVASGGHSHIIRVEDYDTFTIMAATRDDAAGEAFDKVARSAGLGYPGGPKLEKQARGGDPQAIRFPRTAFGQGSLDFSFSGLKTAALNYLNQHPAVLQDEQMLSDFCASYQYAITSVLSDHTLEVAEREGLTTVAVAGGVAANGALRDALLTGAKARGWRFFVPPAILCTDNAAMTASMGGFMVQAGRSPAGLDLEAVASQSLERYTQTMKEDIHGETTRH